MSHAHRRIVVVPKGDISIVSFMDENMIDAANIREMGDELFGLIDIDRRKSIILRCIGVDFMSSAALNKLIVLDRKVKAASGRLCVCDLIEKIRDVFAITKLDRTIEVQPTLTEALRAWS